MDQSLTCDHDWEELISDMGNSEHQTMVACTKCGVPGARSNKTGEVYWPAT